MKGYHLNLIRKDLQKLGQKLMDRS